MQDLTLLAIWTKEQAEICGSYTELARRLGISRQAILKWKDNKLKKGLELERLGRIAQYRGETIAETTRWLQNQGEPEHHDLVAVIKDAPMEVVAAAVAAGLLRMQAEADRWNAPKLETPIARFIKAWLTKHRMSESEFELLIMQRTDMTLGSLQSILRSDRDITIDRYGDIELLGLGSVLSNGNDEMYSLEELREICNGVRWLQPCPGSSLG